MQFEKEYEKYTSELLTVMEYQLHDYYKILADLKMLKPTEGRLSKVNGNRADDLHELVMLHQKAEASLMGSEFDQLEQYTEKFRHFVHLFFAEEKLELESKFRENVQVKYVCHRSASNRGNKTKNPPLFVVYVFDIPAEAIEDLVLYQMVSINRIQGKITSINRNTNCIEVAFKDKKGNMGFEEKACYCFEIDFNERQYEAFMFSIYCVEQGKADFVVFPDPSELISEEEFASRLVEFKSKCKSDPDLMRFDQQQQLAIFSIVNGIHGTVPFVLWGPPGTGKTVTLVECVRQLMRKDESNRILICTPSNTAADLIARRILKTEILKSTQMRRYYSLGKSIDERDQELDDIIKMENCSIYGLVDERFKIDTYSVLVRQNVRLVFATLACSAYLSEEIKTLDFFSHIFIDEAGQSIEPETLIPITRFATRNTRVVLCGDHQQLGPVVKAHFLKAYKSCHLSLMERLMTTMRDDSLFGTNGQKSVYVDGRTFCQLTDSYRCHPTIINFSSVNFYDSTLRAINEENRRSFCDWKHLPSKNFPVIFHAVTKGAEVQQVEGRSYHNEEEVEIVLKYIELLRETGHIEDTDIGVISPYKQQTLKIRNCLADRRITVNSVECYQGSERRVIILTLSRSKQIGFLSEYKRLNTSLTRAKELVIVVASLDFVRNLNSKHPSNYWTRFINYCIDNNAVLVDGFAGNLDFNQQIAAHNSKLLRKCLTESFFSDFTRIERKKKPEFMNFSPPIQKYSEPNSSNSESDDEDEGTVSDLSPLSSSSDEEGKKFWARQIPWRRRPSEKKFVRGRIEQMANAMDKLMANNDTDDIPYEDLTRERPENWLQDGSQYDDYDKWGRPANAMDNDEVKQNGNEKDYGNAFLPKAENTTEKPNYQQKISRIPEDTVRDRSRQRPIKAKAKDLAAEIATSVEDGSFGAPRRTKPQDSDPNCNLM